MFAFVPSVEFLANTRRFYIICKDYDSINQHSHPSTTTPPTPTGGGAGNHDHPRGGWGCQGLCHIQREGVPGQPGAWQRLPFHASSSYITGICSWPAWHLERRLPI